MNLLLEQRPTAITSKLQSNDVKNHYTNSPLVLKIKRQKNVQDTSISSPMANEDNNQRLKRSTPNSSTRRPSSPAFNGKQQSSKRSVIIDNNNNNLTPNIDENSSTKRFKQEDLNLKKKVDACVETVSIGLATEPDQLGPCEPGTSVVLEGIVWNETDSGVLVVNVTWRGKTYVGTLLDSTKQDWACPRLTCESPTSDYDARSSSKTSRAKRANANGNHRSSSQQLALNNQSSSSDDRRLRSSSIKSRQSKRTNLSTIDEVPSSASPLTSPFPTNTTFFPSSSSSSNQESQLIPCPESQCHKQFVSTIALNYHLSNAHKKTADSISTVSIQQANTRDEEDVAHILANVADYVRRPSPRSSPDHQRSTTLTWPNPQISSNLVLSSSLNNNEQTLTRTNTERDEMKSTVKPADHVLLHIQDEPALTSSSSSSSSSSSWSNPKTDGIDNPKKSSPTSFVPITINPTVQHPPPSSSPAYSDISDEDPVTTNENEQTPPPSTVNLLNEQSVIPNNTTWSQQMLLQYGSLIQQMNKDATSHCLNSKPNPNSTSDSTVKNILDSRGSSIPKPPSPSSSISPTTNDSLLNDFQKTLYHYSPNGISNDSKISPTMVNSLTSPNENLLNPSTTTTR